MNRRNFLKSVMLGGVACTVPLIAKSEGHPLWKGNIAIIDRVTIKEVPAVYYDFYTICDSPVYPSARRHVITENRKLAEALVEAYQFRKGHVGHVICSGYKGRLRWMQTWNNDPIESLVDRAGEEGFSV